MPFEDVLVHRGTPLRRSSGGTWVEGEYVPNPGAEGTPFDCVLFLPQATGEQTVALGRRITEPTLLYEPEDRTGGMVALSPEDEVFVVAPEINVAEGRVADASVLWAVLGRPQPFGKPGEDVIGFQATLRRVEE